MAPRKGETSDEKLSRLYNQAATTMQKADLNKVIIALKTKPECIAAVKNSYKTRARTDEQAKHFDDLMR